MGGTGTVDFHAEGPTLMKLKFSDGTLRGLMKRPS